MSAGHGEKMSRKQEAAIAALLTEPTVERAAEVSGVPYRTVKHWLTVPSFQSAYRRARTQLLERVVARLLSTTTEAVDTLRRNLDCGKPSVEIRAAGEIVKQALHGAEVLDLQVEVEELRAIVDKLMSEKGDR